jgi:hypothetical protein
MKNLGCTIFVVMALLWIDQPGPARGQVLGGIVLGNLKCANANWAPGVGAGK